MVDEPFETTCILRSPLDTSRSHSTAYATHGRVYITIRTLPGCLGINPIVRGMVQGVTGRSSARTHLALLSDLPCWQSVPRPLPLRELHELDPAAMRSRAEVSLEAASVFARGNIRDATWVTPQHPACLGMRAVDLSLQDEIPVPLPSATAKDSSEVARKPGTQGTNTSTRSTRCASSTTTRQTRNEDSAIWPLITNAECTFSIRAASRRLSTVSSMGTSRSTTRRGTSTTRGPYRYERESCRRSCWRAVTSRNMRASCSGAAKPTPSANALSLDPVVTGMLRRYRRAKSCYPPG